MDALAPHSVEAQEPGTAPQEDMPLAVLLSRVLDRGVVLTGDVVIGVAGVDLLYLGLDLVLASVESLDERGARPLPSRRPGG